MLFSGIPFLYCFLACGARSLFCGASALKKCGALFVKRVVLRLGRAEIRPFDVGRDLCYVFFRHAAEKLRNKKGGKAFFLVCVLFYVACWVILNMRTFLFPFFLKRRA